MNKKRTPNKPLQKRRRPLARPRTLGPVFDLEEHVPSDWWGMIFNSLYLKTDADVVDDLPITKAEIDIVLEVIDPPPDPRILDLCCGQGRHTLELARRGFRNVEGLDRSHYLIQKAKEKAQNENLKIRFREGDARKLPYQPDTFDLVLILGNSFGYFETLNDDYKVLKEVTRVLKPWGKVFIDIADGEFIKANFQSRSWEWIDKRMFVCRERSFSKDNERLVSREVITHVEKGVIADQFYAERLYSRQSLQDLLTNAGFSNFAIASEFKPQSQRGQDLGMMEQRIMIYAQIKKEWTPIKSKLIKDLRHVVVILGDPQKPDLLKPLHVFDDDDFYTIDQMKAALQELTGYHFTYLNSHDALMQTLMKMTSKIDLVFNLCDEGYDNDPRKELLVPSILEILNLPYTGAGPQCLAFCYDKSLVRGAAKEMEIPTPEAFFIKPEDSTFEIPINFPVLVKPNQGDSSFGITERSVANTAEELINAVNEIRQKLGYDKPLLVEEFLTGADLSVGIIGNPPSNYFTLPIIEEDYSALPEGLPRICGYEAKWRPDSPYWNIKSKLAEIPEDTKKAINEWCVKLFERLECRDYARFDWRLNSDGTPKLLEVNPNPGWCWDGHLAKMANLADISYPQMLREILKAAEIRLGLENDSFTT